MLLAPIPRLNSGPPPTRTSRRSRLGRPARTSLLPNTLPRVLLRASRGGESQKGQLQTADWPLSLLPRPETHRVRRQMPPQPVELLLGDRVGRFGSREPESEALRKVLRAARHRVVGDEARITLPGVAVL